MFGKKEFISCFFINISIVFLLIFISVNPVLAHTMKLSEFFTARFTDSEQMINFQIVIEGEAALKIRKKFDGNQDNTFDDSDRLEMEKALKKDYVNHLQVLIDNKPAEYTLSLFKVHSVIANLEDTITGDSSLIFQAQYLIKSILKKDIPFVFSFYIEPLVVEEAGYLNQNCFITGQATFDSNYINIVSDTGIVKSGNEKKDTSIKNLIFTRAKKPITITGISKKSFNDLKKDPIDPLKLDNPSVTKSNAGISSLGKNRLVEYFDKKNRGFSFYVIALLTAFVLGAFHALSPGHGKTVVAAYLVGAKGTVKHAVILGIVVTFTHVFSVFLIGFLTLYLQNFYLKEQLIPYLEIFSSLLILGIGIWLFTKRFSEYRASKSQAAHTHDHEHSHAAHTHKHDHDHSHADHTHDHTHSEDEVTFKEIDGKVYHSHGGGSYHTHAVPDNITLTSLITLGISGGLVPCPTAFVVLLAAISLNQLIFGLNLIVSFSFGLAAVLIFIGILVAKSIPLVSKLDESKKWIKILPIISAVFVSLIGVLMFIIALDSLSATKKNTLIKTEIMKNSSAKANTGSSAIKEITDAIGVKHIFSKDIKSFICSGSGCLRYACYLNAQDMAVAVDDCEKRESWLNTKPYSLANPDLSQKPLFGEFRGKDNPELILALDKQPQVIFKTYPLSGHNPVELEQKTGIPVVSLEYGDLVRSPETVYSSLKLMGRVLAKTKRADQCVAYFKSQIKDLATRVSSDLSKKNPLCYAGGVSFKGAHGLLSTEPGYSSFDLVSALNVAGIPGDGKNQKRHAIITAEQLLKWDPDYIFLDPSSILNTPQDNAASHLKKDAVYKSLKAVKNREVFFLLPYNSYTTNHGSVLANAWFIGKILYPSQFSDINPYKKADEIFRFLFKKPVFSKIDNMFKNRIFKNMYSPEAPGK